MFWPHIHEKSTVMSESCFWSDIHMYISINIYEEVSERLMACLTQQAQARRQSHNPFTSMCSGEYLN